jgi:hypothetical protein
MVTREMFACTLVTCGVIDASKNVVAKVLVAVALGKEVET